MVLLPKCVIIRFPCSRTLLSAWSEVFRLMFESEPDKEEIVIEEDGCSSDAVDIFVGYVYNGSIPTQHNSQTIQSMSSFDKTVFQARLSLGNPTNISLATTIAPIFPQSPCSLNFHFRTHHWCEGGCARRDDSESPTWRTENGNQVSNVSVSSGPVLLRRVSFSIKPQMRY